VCACVCLCVCVRVCVGMEAGNVHRGRGKGGFTHGDGDVPKELDNGADVTEQDILLKITEEP
jgi:hypothetical protein